MKLARNLRHLEIGAERALTRATRSITGISTNSLPELRERAVSFTAINLLNGWSNFQRAYFVCCLLGTKSPLTGTITSSESSSPLTSNQAIGKAINHFRPLALPKTNGEWDSRDEPTWHDSNTLLQLAQAYSFSNLADIQTAFTFGFTAHKDLVVFRNYYGHKNKSTKTKAQSLASKYLISSNIHPSIILLSAPNAAPNSSLIEMWKGELSQTISALCN